jgi:ACR3 family arsenite transporter
MTLHALPALAARHGRLILILGLVAGIGLPDLALAMRPWIGAMVAGLLFLAALRIGPRQVLGALGDVGTSAGLAVLFQIGFPLAAIGLFAVLGLTGTALATFFILMLAAPPVTGSPHLTVMCGGEPAPALRQLVIGTMLLPLTVIPVFWITPSLGDPRAVLGAAGGLMLLITGATGIAFLIRSTVFISPSDEALSTIDGLSAIAMAVVVVGLMSAVGPALRETPLRVGAILLLVCAVNFAVQSIVSGVTRAAGSTIRAPATGIVAGNRNIALFLTVLPPHVLDPILLLVGCYQIPMYLTPALMRRYYAWLTR